MKHMRNISTVSLAMLTTFSGRLPCHLMLPSGSKSFWWEIHAIIRLLRWGNMSNKDNHRLILISAIYILTAGSAGAESGFQDLNSYAPAGVTRHVGTSSDNLVVVEQSSKSIKSPKYQIAKISDDLSESMANNVSEIRLGILMHDVGPFSSSEESGTDANFEVLFNSPEFLEKIRAPRPHLGLALNSDGDTNQAYFGLTWEFDLWPKLFLGMSLGGSFHDGQTKTDRIDKKELGCKLLFRESLEFGYRFGGRHAITAYLDHLSNANLCDKNEGLENVGLRYGYRF